MKNLISFLVLLLLCLPELVYAQNPSIRNEGRSVVQGTDGQTSRLATDRFGQYMPQILTPFAGNFANDTAETGSTTTNIVATAHTIKVGDTVWFGSTSGTRAGVGFVTSIAANSFTITPPLRAAPNNGDFFYVQSSARPGIDSSSGNLIVVPQTNTGVNAANVEDSTPSTGIGGFVIFAAREDALTVATSATNRSGTLKIDPAGRLVITPAVPGETWQSCSASNTGTSDTAIKASVASNRIYVNSISCFNTAAIASSILFKDGATQIYVGGIGNSTLNGVASYQTSLPVPLRLTSATAFNFAMGTTATATTCCAAGYISVN